MFEKPRIMDDGSHVVVQCTTEQLSVLVLELTAVGFTAKAAEGEFTFTDLNSNAVTNISFIEFDSQPDLGELRRFLRNR